MDYGLAMLLAGGRSAVEGRGAQAAAFEDRESVGLVLDCALDSLEHDQVAEAIMKHLDELPRM